MSAGSARRRGGGLVLATFGAGFAVWVLIIWGAVRQTPGWEGWVTGILAGGFAGLLTVLGGLMLVLRITRPPRARKEAVQSIPIDGQLSAVLAELEDARQKTLKRINASALWRAPLGVAVALGLWLLGQEGSDPPDGGDLLAFALVGGGVGYFWAAYKLKNAYKQLYKSRVIPRIAAEFGDLIWRPAEPPLADFRRHRIFPEWDGSKAEDEIIGTYRGLPISIIELTLTRGSGDNEKTVFQGLTAAVELPRNLRGTTVIAPDRGVFGNFTERLRGGPCQPVRLEDPEFERAYEVYGTDQIAARALLTPAFMTRFLELARSGRFGAPVALVQDNRLLIALSAGAGHDMFEPPSFYKPAAAADALARLKSDIRAVLEAADAIIDLDQAARLQPAGR